MTTLEKLNSRDLRFTISPYQSEIRVKKVGRPLFDGKDVMEVVAKLQWAFSIGAQVIEACSYADISKDSFYRYCKSHPEFRNRIEGLQTNPTFLARLAIFKSIQAGDVKTSMWYLERKRPEEFSPNALVAHQLSVQSQRIRHLENLLRQNDIDPL